jgi:hypothetical protein
MAVEWIKQNNTFNTVFDDRDPSICCDSAGNTYIAYQTADTVSGGQPTGNTDIVVLKLDASGNRVWASQNNTINTSGYDYYPRICCDGSGNTYIAYYTDGTVSGGQPTGDMDIVVLKLDATGNRLWAAQNNTFNTVDYDSEPSICCDSLGNTYIAYETDGIVSGGQTTGYRDIVVLKLDATGNRVWAAQNNTFNTISAEYNPSICCDSAGNTYIAYWTSDIVYGGQTTGDTDIVVLKLDATGNRLWAAQNNTINTVADDLYPSICCDGSGNTYIAYYTDGTVSGGQPTGDLDIVVLKLDATGNRLWAAQNNTFNTIGFESNPSICCDSAGNTYIAYQTDGIVSGGQYTGFDDIVVLKLDEDGNRLWAAQNSTFNTSNDEYYPSICCDSSGNAYIAYQTTGTVSGGQPTGNVDIVVMKLGSLLPTVDASGCIYFNNSTTSSVALASLDYHDNYCVYNQKTPMSNVTVNLMDMSAGSPYKVTIKEGDVTVDGSGANIYLEGVFEFPGVCAVNASGQTVNVVIQNITCDISSSSNQVLSGWICDGGMECANDSTLTISGCHVSSSGDMEMNGSGILGANNYLCGDITVTGCYVSSYGNMQVNTGIIGVNNGVTSDISGQCGNISITECYVSSSGNMQVNTGIIGGGNGVGGIVGNITVSGCYLNCNGELNIQDSGIVGGANAQDGQCGNINLTACYINGSGGIQGSYGILGGLNAVGGNISGIMVNGCYLTSQGDVNISDSGIIGSQNAENGVCGDITATGCYISCSGSMHVLNGIMGGNNVKNGTVGNITITDCYLSSDSDLIVSAGMLGSVNGYDGVCGDIAVTGCDINSSGDIILGVSDVIGSLVGGFNGYRGTCGNIEITDCNISGNSITRIGLPYGGILGGYNGLDGSCGTITISGCSLNPSGIRLWGVHSALDVAPQVDGSGVSADTLVTLMATQSSYDFYSATEIKIFITLTDVSGIQGDVSLNYLFQDEYASSMPVYICSVSGIFLEEYKQIILPPYSEGYNIYMPILPLGAGSYTINGTPIMLNTSGETPETIEASHITYGYDDKDVYIGDYITVNGYSYKLLALGSALFGPAGVGIPCFTEDAKVLTSIGYLPICRLKKGMRVITPDRRHVPIVRLRKFTVPANKYTRPCLLPAGKYGCRWPLQISPDHKVQIDKLGTMVRAATLRLPRVLLRGTITYYNVELADQRDKMIVNGVIVESLTHICSDRIKRPSLTATE